MPGRPLVLKIQDHPEPLGKLEAMLEQGAFNFVTTPFLPDRWKSIVYSALRGMRDRVASHFAQC